MQVNGTWTQIFDGEQKELEPKSHLLTYILPTKNYSGSETWKWSIKDATLTVCEKSLPSGFEDDNTITGIYSIGV